MKIFLFPNNLFTGTTLLLLSLSLLLVLFACVQKPAQPGPPKNLRCEYRSNPLGIDTPAPRFSWEVNDPRRGANQSAYQILVASQEKLLRADRGDIWDSGKITSNQSVHVPFAGKKLASGTRYFWKVRTWDAQGAPSPYSKTAWFETALLNAHDWKAQWIGKPAAPKKKIKPWPWEDWIWHPTQKDSGHWVYFRKVFEIPQSPALVKGLLRITADNTFTAFLNGHPIGSGNVWAKIFEFDVTAHLQNGKNLLAISAANTAGDICGLLASLQLTFADSSHQIVQSNASWETTDREEPGWKNLDFDDSHWQKVRVIEKYGGEIWGKPDKKFGAPLPRSVLLRKTFHLKTTPLRARAYVTGLGNYVFYLNGRRVGRDIFTPGWTDYPSRIQYQTYDVTDLLQKGDNAAGALLGNMWWSSGLGWQKPGFYSHGPLRFLLQIEVTYPDGSRDTLVTDSSWRAHDAPVVYNSLYNGETYDARLEQPGWNQPNFSGSGWEKVALFSEKGRLVAQQGPPIRIEREIQPVKITSLDSGKFIFDMGQNFAGFARLQAKGPAGTKIVLRFGELLNPDGTLYTANLRSARATDIFILRGTGQVETFEPHFTYHGYRFVEMSGYPGTPDKSTLTGLVVHSAAPEIGHFACSDSLLNQIQHNISWGLRSNIMSVPTDCPQRDERLGWMGDAQIFSSTACYNRNMAPFFSKWMHDITDCQDADGAVHDVSPTIVVSENAARPAWGDAVVVIPWVVYKFFGDRRILEENFDAMYRWLQYMTAHSRNHLYEEKGYGDWVAVVESPTEPIGSLYYFYDAKLLARMARLLGRNTTATELDHLAQQIAAAYQKRHFHAASGEYATGTQTMNLLPLAFGITPPSEKKRVAERISEDVRKRDDHLSTGFLGTAFLLPVLTDYGFGSQALRVATQRDYPSWGYMVTQGATTIWELWNSDKKGPSMNSRNHFALGSVGEWYFGYLAGLQPDPQKPGFKHAFIRPNPLGKLTWVKASYRSVYGDWTIHWQKSDSTFTLNVTLPANTNATVELPLFGDQTPSILEGGTPLVRNGQFSQNTPGVIFEKMANDRAVFTVGSGTYTLTVQFQTH